MILHELLCVILVVAAISAFPTIKPSSQPKAASNKSTHFIGTGLFYDQYLKNVLSLLKSDEEFRKKLKDTNFEGIKDGKIGQEINFMPLEIREKLNNLKKKEMNRLRKIVEAKSDLDSGRKVKKNRHLNQIADHLDHRNPHTFEAGDLINLIKAAAKDLHQFDKERHEEFKKYEMEREVRRQERLSKLNELDRISAEESYRKHQEEEAAKSNSIHHPGSKGQFEQVWNEEDGLKDQEFDPITFFNLHDINSDQMWDAVELEALFEKELETIYNTTNPDYDVMEMEEERRRMREHVMNEIDKNSDGMVSLDEFITYTKTDGFKHPDENSYRTINQLLLDHSLFTNEELESYRKDIEEQEAEIKKKLEELKKDAKELRAMKNKFEQDIATAAKDGTHQQKKLEFKTRSHEIKQFESEVLEMQKDIKEQHQELKEIKEEAKKHEEGGKAAEKIRVQLDSLPPGEEKLKAVEDAHKQLDQIKRMQGINVDQNKETEKIDQKYKD